MITPDRIPRTARAREVHKTAGPGVPGLCGRVGTGFERRFSDARVLIGSAALYSKSGGEKRSRELIYRSRRFRARWGEASAAN
jgi:hypothetical protein